ncbi:hypothetical protein Hypma_003518 [Hypsizygus marmoreus]|uniref:Uncharacterized protein n=1 Tax=Hypsizygus marmoreus TaxID=39966 RepID=A0A369J1V4_HYPMA|nr:hypothetical protein Hypma_003518 [Hypsizygus marmoreus]
MVLRLQPIPRPMSKPPTRIELDEDELKFECYFDNTFVWRCSFASDTYQPRFVPWSGKLAPSTLKFRFHLSRGSRSPHTTIEYCCLDCWTGSPWRLSYHRMPDPVYRKSKYQYMMDIFVLRSNPTCSEVERSSHELLISTTNTCASVACAYGTWKSCRHFVAEQKLDTYRYAKTGYNFCPLGLFAVLRRDSPVTIVLVPMANTPFSDETTRCGSKVLKTRRLRELGGNLMYT